MTSMQLLHVSLGGCHTSITTAMEQLTNVYVRQPTIATDVGNFSDLAMSAYGRRHGLSSEDTASLLLPRMTTAQTKL